MLEPVFEYKGNAHVRARNGDNGSLEIGTNEFLAGVIEELAVGIVILDNEARPTHWNRRSVELQGFQPTNLAAWTDSIHPDDRDHVLTSWANAVERNCSWAEIYRFVHTSGRVIWVSERAAPLKLLGRHVGFVRTLEDVTALKNAKEELRCANERLQLHAGQLEQEVQRRTDQMEEAFAELDHLSYSIVHDMRAPLRTLQGFSELLLETQSDKLDDQGKDMLARIAAAAKKQDLLIDGVLAYHSYVRDEFPLSPVNLDQVIGDILSLYAPFQQPRSILTVRRPLGFALANETLLTQSLSALLNNAVKFVAEGVTPMIEIASDRTGGKVILSVQDNGIGIAAEFHDRIFKIFHTLHHSSVYGGTGVGLPLARKAVERMGGHIWVESQVGKGATFRIELPAI